MAESQLIECHDNSCLSDGTKAIWTKNTNNVLMMEISGQIFDQKLSSGYFYLINISIRCLNGIQGISFLFF